MGQLCWVIHLSCVSHRVKNKLTSERTKCAGRKFCSWKMCSSLICRFSTLVGYCTYLQVVMRKSRGSYFRCGLMNVVAVSSSETSVLNIYQVTRYNIPEDDSYIIFWVSVARHHNSRIRPVSAHCFFRGTAKRHSAEAWCQV